MRIALRTAAALAMLAVALTALVHTPAVRRYVLRRAAAEVEERLGIDLRADALDYNVFALRVSLRGVRVAAEATPDMPFFTAREVTAEIPRSAVLGPFAIDSVRIDEGRVRVVRDAGGRTNLPDPPGGAGGEPEPLPVRALVANQLRIEIVDRPERIALVLPSVDVALSSDSGRIDLRAPGRLSRGDVAAAVQVLDGALTFDGRNLRVSQLAVLTDDLQATLDGTLALLAAEPRVDLQVSATGDAARLSRWAGLTDPPRGSVDVRAAVAGAFTAPRTTLTFTSPRLDWNGAPVTQVAGSLRVSAEAVELDRLDARVAGGRVNASGTMPLRGDDVRVTASWEGVDVEALASMSGAALPMRPTGRTAGRLDARGPRDDLARWAAEAGVQVNGGATGRHRIAVAGRVEARLAQREWRLRSRDSILVANVPVLVTLGGRLDTGRFPRTTIAGRVEVVRTEVRQLAQALVRTGTAALAAPDVDGSIQAVAAVSGTVARPRVQASGTVHVADVAPLAPDTPLTGPLDATFETDLRTAHLTATATALALSAEGTVGLRAPYAGDVTATVSGLDLERALRGIDTRAPITGTVNAVLHATGALDNWQTAEATLDIPSLDAHVGALPVRLAAPARASVAARVLDITSLDLAAGGTRVSASGRLPLADTAAAMGDATALQVTAAGDVAQFLNAVAATGVGNVPDVSGTGPAALLARITGSAQHPHIVGDLELGPGSVQAGDVPAMTNVVLRAHADGTWVELRSLDADWQGSHVSAAGRVPFAWTGIEGVAVSGGLGTLTARVTSVTPQVLAPFVDPASLEEIAGSVDATLDVRSRSLDLDAVSGELRLDRMHLRIAELPITQREPTRIGIRDGFAQVESWHWTGEGGEASVRGRVRLSDRQAALLADGRFDLRLLTPLTLAAGVRVAGTLDTRLSITGVLDGPRVDGVAGLVDGEVRVANPRLVATGLDGKIVLTGTRAQLLTLGGAINGGTLTGSGAVEYAPRQPTDAAFTLGFRGMALELPEGLHSEIDGDLQLSMIVPAADVIAPEGRVSGSIRVMRGAYREDIGVATGLLAAIRARRLAAEGAAEPSLVDNLVLDVGLATPGEGIVVDNNLGRLGVSADLRIIGTVASPALSGRAQLAEGGELFLGGNRYEIESGTIDFVNPDEIVPLLNITATTRAGGEDIELTIKGTTESPEIEPTSTSNPDLGSADVISLLLTGRRLDEISGDEAEIVGERALAYLSGDVLSVASRAVGLDAIRIGGLDESPRSEGAAAVAAEVNPTARLTFSKSIGRDIDVVFSQGLRKGDAQTWIVDYRPRRHVEARFVSDDEDFRSYRFRHDVTFGGGSASTPVAPRAARHQERVASVSITGANAVPEARLRGVLELQPKDRFDFVTWQRDRDRLEAVLDREGFCEARIAARRSGATKAGNDATKARRDATKAGNDATKARRDATKAGNDATKAGNDATKAGNDATKARRDAMKAGNDATKARRDATKAGNDATKARREHDVREEPVDALALTYAITEGPRCSLEVSGYALDDETQAAVRRTWADAVFEGFVVEETQALVRARLAREGYPRAEVEASVSSEPGQKTLRIRVEPGTRAAAMRLRFTGAEGAVGSALDEWAAAHRAAVMAVDDPPAFERTLTAWLRARGHLRARVAVGTPSVEGTEAIVPVRVDAGPAFAIAGIRIEGAGELPQGTLVAATGLAAGMPFDPAAVDAGRDRLQARYRRDGFADARVDALPSIDDRAAAATVTFRVAEGRRQVLRDVQVAGNRAIDADVIVRAADLPVGEPVTLDDWLQARRRVFETGLFRRADVIAEPMAGATADGSRSPAIAADARELPMRARVVVEEWPALRLRYGFQVAEERPEGEVEGRELEPGLSADLTRRTLFGRAVTLGAAVEYERRERTGRGFLTSRSLFGLPVESSLVIERSREDFTSLDLVTDTTGATWEQRLRTSRHLQVSYAYRFERNRTFVPSAEPGDEFAFDLTVNVAWLNGAAAWDTRDDVADTRRGWLLSSSLDWAPAGLGTDFRFIKYLGQAYHFRPWRGVVLASAARVGLARALGGQDLVLSERYRAGGSRTVRGVAEDSLGPRDIFDDPAGGAALVVLNQEARFGIYRWLRGVAFVDAGNVFADVAGIALGDLIASYGVGLRLATPFAMLRADYGRLFDPRPGQRSGRLTFGIGQTF